MPDNLIRKVPPHRVGDEIRGEEPGRGIRPLASHLECVLVLGDHADDALDDARAPDAASHVGVAHAPPSRCGDPPRGIGVELGDGFVRLWVRAFVPVGRVGSAPRRPRALVQGFDEVLPVLEEVHAPFVHARHRAVRLHLLDHLRARLNVLTLRAVQQSPRLAAARRAAYGDVVVRPEVIAASRHPRGAVHHQKRGAVVPRHVHVPPVVGRRRRIRELKSRRVPEATLERDEERRANGFVLVPRSLLAVRPRRLRVVEEVRLVLDVDGRLERGAREVLLENRRVARIDQRRLRRSPKERLGMRAIERVERALARDDDRERAPEPAARATRLLPHRGRRLGHSHVHRRVEIADVYAHLESAGAHQARHFSARQPPLEVAPQVRVVPTAIGIHARDEVLPPGFEQYRLDVPADALGELPGVDEGQAPDSVLNQAGYDLGSLRVRAPPLRDGVAPPAGAVSPRAAVTAVTAVSILRDGSVLGRGGELGRLPQDHRLLSGRGAVSGHRNRIFRGQLLDQLRGVIYRRRRAYKLRTRSVARAAQANHPSKHVGDVRPKHPPARVSLVHHHELQVLPERLGELLALIPGQQVVVQGVGVGQQQLRLLALDHDAVGLLGVAVQRPHGYGRHPPKLF